MNIPWLVQTVNLHFEPNKNKPKDVSSCSPVIPACSVQGSEASSMNYQCGRDEADSHEARSPHKCPKVAVGTSARPSSSKFKESLCVVPDINDILLVLPLMPMSKVCMMNLQGFLTAL